ncbi:MAG: FG-GAP-like repeat-containing protein, partial [Chthoniobacteraceae bacterium]
SSVSGRAVTVDFATANDSADPRDFMAVNGTLTFAPGEVTKTIAIVVIGDTMVETRERFSVQLANADGARIDDGTGIGSILNDDVDGPVVGGGGVQFTAGAFSVSEGAALVTLSLSRSGGALDATSVPFSTANGTAIAGADYTAITSTVEFAAGQTNATITVPIRTDFLTELNETFTVALGQPTGTETLGARAATTVTIIDNDPAALPDFDNDGNLDLPIFKKSTLNVHLGDGLGGFGPAIEAPKVKGGKEFVFGDFNDDGNDDLVVLSKKKKSANVLGGNGDGTFADPVEFSFGKAAKGLVRGDFDGDGRLDLAAIEKKGIAVLLNDGSGGFGERAFFDPGIKPKSILVSDADNDGDLDLAALGGGGKKGAIAIVPGNGDGTFGSGIKTGVGKLPKAALFADLTGDGIDDLFGIIGKTSVSIFAGDGSGGFAAVAEVVATAKKPKLLAFGDFDNDLDLDFASVHQKMASIITNNGDGTFTAGPLIAIELKKSKAAYAADLDGDDLPDLVFADAKDRFATLLS